MISEKVDAAFEAGSMLANGRRPAEVIDFYRMHVAAVLRVDNQTKSPAQAPG